MPVKPSRILSWAVTILVCFSLSGCAVLTKLEQNSVPVEAESTDQVPSFQVEMHPNFGKPKIYVGQIKKPTTVRDALDESGAMSEFSSMTVDLYRQLPDGRPLKLPVEFKKGKQVRYDQDYALHPNDRVVVRAKSNSPLEKLVEQVFGEL